MTLSTNAKTLLTEASNTTIKQIIKHEGLNRSINVSGGKSFGGESPREYETWLSALDELAQNGMIQTRSNPLVYTMTEKGHQAMEN
jgi:hypothetical protein